MADTPSNRATALSFHSTTFGIVDHQGQPWLKANEIAQALGYADESAINRIYARRSDEFTEKMTLTVNLTVKGFGNGNSEKEVRIFSLRGAHLLAMFARTSVAKEFRTWVLDVLEQQTASHCQAPETTSRIDLARQLAHAATAQVYQAVFDAVLRDGAPPHFTRLLLGFTGNSNTLAPHVQALEAGTMVMTLPQLAKAIRTDLILPDTTLAHLAAACTTRMAEITEAQARRAAAQSATLTGAASKAQGAAHQGRLQLR